MTLSPAARGRLSRHVMRSRRRDHDTKDRQPWFFWGSSGPENQAVSAVRVHLGQYSKNRNRTARKTHYPSRSGSHASCPGKTPRSSRPLAEHACVPHLGRARDARRTPHSKSDIRGGNPRFKACLGAFPLFLHVPKDQPITALISHKETHFVSRVYEGDVDLAIINNTHVS